MNDCDKNNINCPPKYKNIGSQNFGDGKKVTADLLYQFCKNDSYLYKQVMDLWDKTDPETRKRFYPPYYMDTSKSYGVEPLLFEGSELSSDDALQNKVSENDILKLTKSNGTIQNAYHLSNALHEKYVVDFDYTNDRTYWQMNSNSSYDTLVVENDKIIDDASTLKIVAEDYGTADSPNIIHTVLPTSTTSDITSKIPFVTTKYWEEPQTVTKKYTKAERKKLQKKINKKYKKLNKNRKGNKKVDVFGKLVLDAHCSGPYKNWNANSVWYIGYNRHKNYNVKNAWKKDPYNEDKASTKKYGRVPSICRSQTFKALHTGELRKVTFKMKGSSKSVSPCVVEIRTVDKKGKPTQEILARTEQKFNHTTASMVNFTFKKPCVVKKGTTYAIVLRSPLSNFNHCYWIVGWASTCFSNSRKRAYYDGETFLSEDNGKTWIVHGTREKCYGSHYYDWGFAEAPVNFGFEVYIAPKTGTKTVNGKKPLKVPKAPKTYKTTTQVKKSQSETGYYDASITLSYYQAGNYYLHFKPFVGNFYTSIRCIYDKYAPNNEANANIGDFSWEIFNNDEKQWQSFEDFAQSDLCINANNNPYKDPVSNQILSSYELVFNKALTFVQVRLKMSLPKNVLDREFDEELAEKMKEIKAMNDSDASDGQTVTVTDEDMLPWLNAIYNQFAWIGDSYQQNATHYPLGINRLRSVVFDLYKKPSFNGYLRTLEYHPPQEGMLPACIWSEVDVDAIPKNRGTCKVDIVHERTAIDHILLYKINNMELRPYIVEFEATKDKTVGKDEYVIGDLIQDYILKGSLNNYDSVEDLTINQEFVDWLQSRSPKVYLLPFETTIQQYTGVDDSDTGEPIMDNVDIFFYDNWDGENVHLELENYPSYPINSCTIGTDDIHLKMVDEVKVGGKIQKDDLSRAEYVLYEHDEILEGDVNQVVVNYKFTTDEKIAESEDGETTQQELGTIVLNPIEIDESTNLPKVDATTGKVEGDYYIQGNKIYFNITPKAEGEENYAHPLAQFISLQNNSLVLNPCLDNVDSVADNTPMNYAEDLEIMVEKKAYDYIEFQDYLVNYNTKDFNFYNPWALSEGDLKVNYNPLWVRDLDIDDFPLRMDLWTEYSKVRTVHNEYTDEETGETEGDESFVFDKCKIMDCGKIVVNEELQNKSKSYITLSVPPVDNLRDVELQDENGNSLTDEPLVEDEDYYVDYLKSKVDLHYPQLEEGMIVMIKYTPNLTDNGLSIAYRLDRPIYNSQGQELSDPQERLIVDLTSRVNNQLNDDGDDVYVMSNYFTTRT